MSEEKLRDWTVEREFDPETLEMHRRGDLTYWEGRTIEEYLRDSLTAGEHPESWDEAPERQSVCPGHISEATLGAMSEDPWVYLWAEMDPHMIPIVKALDDAGFTTWSSSCQGGPGHVYKIGHIVLKGEGIHTPADVSRIKEIVASFTDVKFWVVKLGKEIDYPPADPGDYLVYFKKPMRLRRLS